MTEKPNRRPLKFSTLEESQEEIQRLKESGYIKGGEWDLGQMVEHLNKTMKMSFDGADFGMPFFVQPVFRGIFMTFILPKGKQMKGGAKAPPQLTPGEEIDLDQQIREYEALTKKLYEEESAIIPKHPILGKFKPQQWRAFHAWHAAHHLSFLHPKGETENSD